MSPESARPVDGGPSMAGVQRSISLPPRGLLRSPNALSVASTSLTRSGARCRTDSSRTAACNAPVSGRRRLVSGRASTFPVPHPRSNAFDRSALSRTVLPTPRSPVSTRLRSGRPRSTRSKATSNAPSSASRPASSGGRWPAPGAYGFRTGSTSRTVSTRIARTLDFVRQRSTCRTLRAAACATNDCCPVPLTTLHDFRCPSQTLAAPAEDRRRDHRCWTS